MSPVTADRQLTLDPGLDEQAILALCNIGWELRLSLDTMKELGIQEKVESVLSNADETTQHWGNVLVEKLRKSGFQRGCLLDKDLEGRATGFSSREHSLSDCALDSPLKQASSERGRKTLEHGPFMGRAAFAAAHGFAVRGQEAVGSLSPTPGTPHVPLAPSDVDLSWQDMELPLQQPGSTGVYTHTTSSTDPPLLTRPPPRSSILSTPRGHILTPGYLTISTSPLFQDLADGSTSTMHDMQASRQQASLSSETLMRNSGWDPCTNLQTSRLTTAGLSSASSTSSFASGASVVTAGW